MTINQSNCGAIKLSMRRLITCLPQAGIHNNPVEEVFVFKPEDYLYNSATDYTAEKGLLDNVIVVK